MLSDQSFTSTTELGDKSTISQLTPSSNAVITFISLAVKKYTVLTELRDFETLIRLNPLAQSITRLNDGDTGDSSLYKIVDRLKLCGITFSQSYTAKFTIINDGLLVLVKAGKMVSINARWLVEDDGLNQVKLSETVQVECPRILQSYIISQIKSNRVSLFQGLCKGIYHARDKASTS